MISSFKPLQDCAVPVFKDHPAIVASACQGMAIRAEAQPENSAGVGHYSVRPPVIYAVEDHDIFVTARSSNPIPCWIECNSIHPSRIPPASCSAECLF